MHDNSFEKDPGKIETKAEREIPQEEDFEKSFSNGVPEFAGERYGVAHEENQFYGETTGDSELDDGISDAASIINYGVDAIAREKGVEYVVSRIKSFDPNGSDNPIRDLFQHLGLNNTEEIKEASEEAIASKQTRAAFRSEYNMPKPQEKSREGALKAIADMKELISEVESADPRYEEMREGARRAQMGYFEFAVKDFGKRGLTELFSVLAEQGKSVENEDEDKNEVETEPKVETQAEGTQPDAKLSN